VPPLSSPATPRRPSSCPTISRAPFSAFSCSLGLSATSQQYFSLRTNQPPATSQQYSSLRRNQHQPSATSQPNRLSETLRSRTADVVVVCGNTFYATKLRYQFTASGVVVQCGWSYSWNTRMKGPAHSFMHVLRNKDLSTIATPF
jgi:hypothetical protein